MPTTDLKGLTLAGLEEFVHSIGERRYRGKQIFDWLYGKEVSSFEAMTSLSKPLRDKLASAARIDSIKCIARQYSSADGTTKFLFELTDGKRIETVLIPPRTAYDGTEARGEDEQKRLTVCVSTQVGCALGCVFCATASMGIVRNLTASEIVDQLLQAKALSGKRITNIVFMGMGEPLMNYEHVMAAAEIFSHGLKIAARHITLSTAGWVPKIRQMADEGRRLKLAVSLHTLDKTARSDFMPIDSKFPLDELIAAVEYYVRKTKQRVTFEYILFDGWNDRDDDLRRLIALSKRIPCKVNIIPFHNIAFTRPSGLSARLHPTPAARMEEFVRRLREAHVTVFVRSSAGEDIDAACGQLAVKSERDPRRRRPGQQIPTTHLQPA